MLIKLLAKLLLRNKDSYVNLVKVNGKTYEIHVREYIASDELIRKYAEKLGIDASELDKPAKVTIPDTSK